MPRKEIIYLDCKVPEVPPGREEELYPSFNTTQRRAIVSRMILETGHPRAVNQTTIAKLFGVKPQAVSRDFQVVLPQIVKILKRNGEAVIHTVMNKAIKDCIQGTNAEKRQAANLAKDYHGMLVESGDIDRAPNETLKTEIDWSKAYEDSQKEDTDV